MVRAGREQIVRWGNEPATPRRSRRDDDPSPSLLPPLPGPAPTAAGAPSSGDTPRLGARLPRRWQHDRVVRSTHGVNCTGSCSWKIHVKDGLVTWETQQTDYPRNGPETPDYEPRGCPRGASFSWYVYSPLRPKYPYIRGALLEMYREARRASRRPGRRLGLDRRGPREGPRPTSPSAARAASSAPRWDEAAELVAAAHVHTARRYGPDRLVGFSPIPAMSMVSYAAGTRFLSLIGGVSLDFYDWYADLPPASPQVWGDQTDVPESADWWNAGYLMLWGSNIPQTRTPDAHFMTEARYRGQKVVVVSPDYAGPHQVRRRLAAGHAGHRRRPGDGDGPRHPQGVLRRPRSPPYFTDYARSFTDLPLLVDARGARRRHLARRRFLRAADLGDDERERRVEDGR